MDAITNSLPLLCTLVGAAGVVFSILLATNVRSAPAGNEKMQEIARQIHQEENLLSVEDSVVPVKEIFRLQDDQEIAEAEIFRKA